VTIDAAVAVVADNGHNTVVMMVLMRMMTPN
jgi:hypothetical protein